MKSAFPLLAIALLAGCSDDTAAQQASATPSPPAAQQPAAPPAAPEQADVAAVEAAEPQKPAADPCDLSGYDMSKMTADMHEELVKRCEQSKQ